MLKSALALLPRGYTLPEADWQRRHSLLMWILLAHVPMLALFGITLSNPWYDTVIAVTVPGVATLAGFLLRTRRRVASVAVTFGYVFCSWSLVALTGGTIEAHFHFFIIIGFIALYQDWVPFLFNVGFTVLSHGLGSAFQQSLIFNHSMGQANPWLWSLIHGVAVLAGCVGMIIFWRVTEDQQHEKDELARELAEAEIGRRRFTSDLLVNLARRNQSMLHRQMQIINQLEESERDPDALAELFKLDHITTRVRRNAESLLVLSGEQPARVWSEPVPLRDVVLAAIAETEDLGRIVHEVDDDLAVAGGAVTDITHLLAELAENAVRFSPPDAPVTVRVRPHRGGESGVHVLTVEDWGLGLPAEDLEAANRLLADPPDIDLAVHQRLGFHVVARLARRHGVGVALTPTPGSGTTAVVTLPASLFQQAGREDADASPEAGFALPVRVRAHAPAGGSPAGGSWPAELPDPVGADSEATLTLAALRPPPPAAPPVPPARSVPVPEPTSDWSGWWDRQASAAAAANGARTASGYGGDGARAPIPRTPVAPSSVSPSSVAQSPVTRSPESPSPVAHPPVPRPRTPVVEEAVGEPPAVPTGTGPTGLRRRVPQASLAPALRRDEDVPDPSVPGPGADAPRLAPGAATALSRYQASRQAAHDDIDRGAL